MMNCFRGVVDQQKAFSLISSQDHCQISSPSRISDTQQAGFELMQNLSSGLVELSCAVVIATGRDCFKGLPYGIHSASKVFQREITSINSDIPGSANSQDDIVVWGRTLNEHNEHLKSVFEDS